MENDIRQKEKELQEINLKEVIRKLWAKKKIFAIVIPAVMIVSSLLIICVPRYYSSEIKLAPEYDLPNTGSLSSIASQFGFDIGGVPTTDAISPELYPDLMESTSFIVRLFSIKVKSEDGTIDTDYYTYLKQYQKSAWWSSIIFKIKAFFDKSLLPSDKGVVPVDPFHLTRDQFKIAESIKKSVNCSVDKKTNVISFSVKAQDPVICASLADSIRAKLQTFITEYRTNKSRKDLEYYEKLTNEALESYVETRREYAAYYDANTDALMASVKSKLEDMENDMQLKFNTYSALKTQMQTAKAKVQEKTPAFTILQSATVPIKAAGPKRMLFVIGMTILAIFITALILERKDLHLTF